MTSTTPGVLVWHNQTYTIQRNLIRYHWERCGNYTEVEVVSLFWVQDAMYTEYT
jgi:hypothetical protein